MKNLVQIYDSYTTFSGIKVPIKINWSSVGAVSIDEAQQFCWQLQDKIKQAREMEKEEYVSDSDCMNRIKQHSERLGLKEPMTLSDLFEAHLSLRELNKKTSEEWGKELNKAREIAKQSQLDNDWIKIETLQGMTVQELSEFLAR